MPIDDDLNLQVEDFDLSDFDDPIKLLAAISQKQSGDGSASILRDNCIQITNMGFPNCILTISTIAKYYGLPIDIIHSAIKAKALKPVAYIPLFTNSGIANYLASQNGIEKYLLQAIIQEAQNMRTNYSYKPVLLLAIIERGNDLGEVAMTDIVDYFMDYYAKRRELGICVEKPDSSFVKHPFDRVKAKKTIIAYPVRIFVEKGFLTYDRETGVVTVIPTIWNNLTEKIKGEISEYCNNTLEKYYKSIIQ